MKRIEIRSGPVGKNTDVWVDGVKQEQLVSAIVEWTVADVNFVTLRYIGVDLDVDTEAEGAP